MFFSSKTTTGDFRYLRLHKHTKEQRLCKRGATPRSVSGTETNFLYLRHSLYRKRHYCQRILPVANPFGQQDVSFPVRQGRHVSDMTTLPYRLYVIPIAYLEHKAVGISEIFHFNRPYSGGIASTLTQPRQSKHFLHAPHAKMFRGRRAALPCRFLRHGFYRCGFRLPPEPPSDFHQAGLQEPDSFSHHGRYLLKWLLRSSSSLAICTLRNASNAFLDFMRSMFSLR